MDIPNNSGIEQTLMQSSFPIENGKSNVTELRILLK